MEQAPVQNFDAHMLSKYVELATSVSATMASFTEIQRQHQARTAQDEERDRERDKVMERIASALDRTEKSLDRSEQNASSGRVSAVAEIKEHIDEAVKQSGRWSTIWLGILSSAAVVIAGALALIAVRMH